MNHRYLTQISTFFYELKRRRVFRVAAVYAVISWLIIQIAETTFPYLHLPDWTITFVIVLAMLGFPVTLILAWAYDITPEGIERTPAQSDASGPKAPPVGDRVPAPPAIVGAPPAAGGARSVAVLPLVNLSRDEENEYFADGMTEELISVLGRVQGLRIAARTSAFAFKGKDVDVREIGQKLGVATILEGSVRRSGARLRIVVQLVNASDGYQLWSSTYDRQLEDVFALQEEIATAIASALRVQLVREDSTPLVRSTTRNLDAYNLYLKGRYFWNKRTGEALRTAVEFFERAIAADPDYALAHAGLADSYAILIDHGLLPARETLPKVQEAALRALELDDSLAEAHTSLALAHQFAWDWAAAEQEFRTAIKLNPNYPVAHHRYALLLAWTGRFKDGLREIRLAQAIDPLSLVVSASIGWILYNGRQFDAAIEQYQRTIALEPNFVLAYIFWGLALNRVGRYQEAIDRLETAWRLSGGTSVLSSLLAFAYGTAGDLAGARAKIAVLEEQAERTYVSPYYLAVAQLGVGNTARALDYLEQGYRERCAHLIYIAVEPLLDPLRSEFRFQTLLKESGITAGPVEVAQV